MTMKLSMLDQVRETAAEHAHFELIQTLANTPRGKLLVGLIDTAARPSDAGSQHKIKDTDLLEKIRDLIVEHYKDLAGVTRETLFQLGVNPDQ